MSTFFNILDIRRGTTVDGPGFRTSIYFAGCNHHCKDCHNPDSWDFNGGKRMSLREILEIIKEEDFNVTLTGGDPLMHPEEIAILAKEINNIGYSIWLYTGYTIEQIQTNPRLSLPLPYLEAIVDGPFLPEEKDPDLLFRGSRNQRIIYMNDLNYYHI
ncbi:MAG: anaerobic ribonucleoside-triphosphate reductase activating protein [Muribaculaceae bacterium]|nr:anaerobic ribonucleoside-triphosphate reductase activating protein [Muribaculaceae bacterium]